MQFNSIDFGLFVPAVFFLYWFLCHRNLRVQNLLMVAASFLFYGLWSWKFLSLIVFSIAVDYGVGLALGATEDPRRRKLLLGVSLTCNLGLLLFFKYYHFFVDNFIAAFTLFGAEFNPGTLRVILPVGISFYTFQTLSYTIDVYRRDIEPTRSLIAFAAFVSFFPQLVAGPIERAYHLLPQFLNRRRFDREAAVDGMRQVLWGLFKKVVIADRTGQYVDLIYQDPGACNSSTLVWGTFLFGIQIYADFSGYSDIAIGTARLFGFSLRRNFAFPFFSRDIAEYWRRWHISLSSWFRDYLYFPLGGSRVKNKAIRNSFIVFLVSGFWHGANWTFIVWGALNAFYYLPLQILGTTRRHLDTVAAGRLLPSFREAAQIVMTFGLVSFGWVFFRADNMTDALHYLRLMLSSSLLHRPSIPLANGIAWDLWTDPYLLVLFAFFALEWLGRDGQYGPDHWLPKLHVSLRWAFYLLLMLMILLLSGPKQSFIYFQF